MTYKVVLGTRQGYKDDAEADSLCLCMQLSYSINEDLMLRLVSYIFDKAALHNSYLLN